MRKPRELRHDPLNTAIALLLRTGVLVCAVLLVAGLVALALHGGTAIDPSQFTHFDRSRSVALATLPARLGQAQPQAILELGLVVLFLVPVSRLALAAVLFARARDRLYTVISLLVLGIVIASTLLGRAV